ncbi:MAG: hypothetical protein ABI707_02700 [Ferruginibacter sp.]
MKKISGGYLSIIRQTMLCLPGVTEGTCFGTETFYVSKKLLARMKEDNETLVVFTPDRDEWTNKDESIFFVTDHYRNYPFVLVSLSKVKKSDLSQILNEAWKNRAGKKLLNLARK